MKGEWKVIKHVAVREEEDALVVDWQGEGKLLIVDGGAGVEVGGVGL